MNRFFKHSLAGICTILLILFSVYFSACSMGGGDSSGKETPDASTSVVFPSKADPDGGDITFDAELYYSFFEDVTKYSETLALTSLCMTVAAEKKDTLTEAFKDFNFNKIETYNGSDDDYDKKMIQIQFPMV